MNNKKAIFCFFGISAAIALFTFNGNTTKHESDQIISMQAQYDIKGETIDFELEEPTVSQRSMPATTVIIEKTADISQKYPEVDFNLNTVKKTNIYENDSVDSTVIETVAYYTNIKCIGEDIYNEDGFYKIEHNGNIGYIQKSFLTDEIMFNSVDKKIIITNPTTLYEDPTKENTIAILENGTYSIDIENDEWIRVKYNDSNGYINIKEVSNEILEKADKKRYLISKSDVYNLNMEKTSAKNVTSNVLYSNDTYSIIENKKNTYVVKNTNLTDKAPETNTKKPTITTIQANSAVEFAYAMLGVRYSYGSASTSATDCSGLTMQCYKSQGISIPRTASAQYRSGTKIDYNNIQPGDLIAWSGNGGKSVTHIGIYIGNGQFIHASSGRGEVMISDVAQYKTHSTYVGAVRY